ncbi:hypothetical protein N6H14_10640 [Paenibacillus sp. CC-CFT747]|nr:hypothetical protein N6H14_10640 [Paenibacillus sp. CC-CFT747]
MGFVNMVILGIVCALVHEWLRRNGRSQLTRMAVLIVVINVVNVVDIALLGVIEPTVYLWQIASRTLPLSLVLSAFFTWVLWDLREDYRSREDLQLINHRLEEQVKISGEKPRS